MSRPLHLAGLGNIGSPTWPPDVTLILFNSDRTGQLGLYAKDLAGLVMRQMTSGEGNEFNGVSRPSGGATWTEGFPSIACRGLDIGWALNPPTPSRPLVAESIGRHAL
jgi:hypothetical protein